VEEIKRLEFLNRVRNLRITSYMPNIQKFSEVQEQKSHWRHKFHAQSSTLILLTCLSLCNTQARAVNGRVFGRLVFIHFWISKLTDPTPIWGCNSRMWFTFLIDSAVHHVVF